MNNNKQEQSRKPCEHVFQDSSECCIYCGANMWDKDYDKHREPAPQRNWQDDEEWTSDY